MAIRDAEPLEEDPYDGPRRASETAGRTSETNKGGDATAASFGDNAPTRPEAYCAEDAPSFAGVQITN